MKTLLKSLIVCFGLLLFTTDSFAKVYAASAVFHIRGCDVVVTVAFSDVSHHWIFDIEGVGPGCNRYNFHKEGLGTPTPTPDGGQELDDVTVDETTEWISDLGSDYPVTPEELANMFNTVNNHLVLE